MGRQEVGLTCDKKERLTWQRQIVCTRRDTPRNEATKHQIPVVIRDKASSLQHECSTIKNTSTSGQRASDGAPPVSSLPTAKIDETTDLSLQKNTYEIREQAMLNGFIQNAIEYFHVHVTPTAPTSPSLPVTTD